MTVYRETIRIKTSGKCDMTDITPEVNRILDNSNIKTGICHIFNVGSTGIIGTIEFEPGLEKDFPELLNRLIPQNRNYGHELTWHDGNGHSHLQASLAGPDITVPVEESRILNGTWQQIFHYEADNKPRNRKIIVTVIGE
ncbi:MAG: secondary thiamine-phosphate synthase enzyme YjbQ [Victivallales bacterium]|nr:secondary thiamine-phosphate synthase enzyme YjbQ [Victivallales bacterium]